MAPQLKLMKAFLFSLMKSLRDYQPIITLTKTVPSEFQDKIIWPYSANGNSK